ncbi:uncharacterized protein MONOS_18420 [Monocercomonoides exilis]|uniref:uncharacterized protein n=1 Tax=Monocercomonoides exilis TaxID=2049356 RepID=UPI00355A0809|nr:hypothetical protein MONOS_18420 [Monocercomonoides exilis]
MSLIDHMADEKANGGKVKFSQEDFLYILKEFYKRCCNCGSGKNMAIVLGRSQVGKSTMINKLRGVEMEEDDNGDLVVKTKVEDMAKMGKGIEPETIIPESYGLNEKVILLDTRGFLGSEVDVKEEVVTKGNIRNYREGSRKFDWKIYRTGKTTVDKIEKKFPEIKAAQSLEQIIGILLQKAKGATGVQGEEIRRSLNQLQTLLVWKKAHANGRLIYYDPTLDGSEEPIKDEIKNLNNYKSPNDVNLDRCTPSYYCQEGRVQVPNMLQEIIEACKDFAKDSEKLYSEVSDDVEELEDKLRNITFESEESIETKIKNQENTIRQCNDDVVEYQKRINELDQPETVKFDTIEFCEFDNYASNEVVIERPINVPNATCFFTAGNKYTYNDKEEQEVCIKDGVLRGVFKAPKALRHALNVVGAVVGLGIPTAFLNDSSVCEGKIDLFAPKRDIPSNRQKIQEYQIKVKECENRKEECGISIDTLKRELDMVQKRNDRKKDEINTNEKRRGIWRSG